MVGIIVQITYKDGCKEDISGSLDLIEQSYIGWPLKLNGEAQSIVIHPLPSALEAVEAKPEQPTTRSWSPPQSNEIVLNKNSHSMG